ncbi:MAG: DUF5678 domain-containing protein [Patescibacteria group bacterium]|nr:hypothetical protein [Patescibacteria group bacterium]MBU1350098.1 hypothetical protein [Patescibacteria group bacterium]MBU1421132.1 hypothetical protein [Patescibacteria group bacterium]MBU1987606.1 hypothetical protein [Patescibacteria group bacterium]MBU2415951.1 hypothetical protein [Patescibacteria group bacterium]
MKKKQTTTKQNTSLDRYAGKWVALVDAKPIISGKTLNILMAKAKEKYNKKELENLPVTLIPYKDEGPYIL